MFSWAEGNHKKDQQAFLDQESLKAGKNWGNNEAIQN